MGHGVGREGDARVTSPVSQHSCVGAFVRLVVCGSRRTLIGELEKLCFPMAQACNFHAEHSLVSTELLILDVPLWHRILPF